METNCKNIVIIETIYTIWTMERAEIQLTNFWDHKAVEMHVTRACLSYLCHKWHSVTWLRFACAFDLFSFQLNSFSRYFKIEKLVLRNWENFVLIITKCNNDMRPKIGLQLILFGVFGNNFFLRSADTNNKYIYLH